MGNNNPVPSPLFGLIQGFVGLMDQCPVRMDGLFAHGSYSKTYGHEWERGRGRVGQAQILHSGAKSILPAADTRLYDGAEGTLDGTPFEVVGHVRYAHPSGQWDEWYLEVQGQGAAGRSEDEVEHEGDYCPLCKKGKLKRVNAIDIEANMRKVKKLLANIKRPVRILRPDEAIVESALDQPMGIVK